MYVGPYDVIGITRHLHIKLKSFSEISQSLHKEAVRDCSCLYIIAEKSVIISEAVYMVNLEYSGHKRDYKFLYTDRDFRSIYPCYIITIHHECPCQIDISPEGSEF